MPTPDYAELNQARLGLNDENACGPIAIAAVTGASFQQAYDWLAAKGRKHRGTCNWGQINTVLTEQGYRLLVEAPKSLTPISVGKKYPKGRHLCITAEHIFALVDGKVIDWTEGRKHRIQYVIHVTKGV